MGWYVTNTTGSDQGLVVDEDTGASICVTYKDESRSHAILIASAPELLATLERVQSASTLEEIDGAVDRAIALAKGD